MDTISIKSKEPFLMDSIKKALFKSWAVEVTAYDGLTVHGENGRVYIHLNETLSNPKEFELLLDYSDIELVKSVLNAIADDSELIVDNDFGTILPGDQFVARCRSEESWNWRDS
jgi:hypothetical protein